jgi:hypothetical protein
MFGATSAVHVKKLTDWSTAKQKGLRGFAYDDRWRRMKFSKSPNKRCSNAIMR